MLLEAIDRNGAGDCLNPGFREVDLIAQPCGRDDAIGVGVGKPYPGKAVRVLSIA